MVVLDPFVHSHGICSDISPYCLARRSDSRVPSVIGRSTEVDSHWPLCSKIRETVLAHVGILLALIDILIEVVLRPSHEILWERCGPVVPKSMAVVVQAVTDCIILAVHRLVDQERIFSVREFPSGCDLRPVIVIEHVPRSVSALLDAFAIELVCGDPEVASIVGPWPDVAQERIAEVNFNLRLGLQRRVEWDVDMESGISDDSLLAVLIRPDKELVFEMDLAGGRGNTLGNDKFGRGEEVVYGELVGFVFETHD